MKPSTSKKPANQERGRAETNQPVRVRRDPDNAGDTDSADAPLSATEGAHPAPAAPTSGVLADHDDTDSLPVEQTGLPVTPEELAKQFLRDATQQDNFEGQHVRRESPATDPSADATTSEASVKAAGQEDREIPISSSLRD